MTTCNKDCLNCILEVCKYDTEDGRTRHIVSGKVNGLGERLRTAMKMRRMYQRTLARVTGITEPTISAYVNDTRKPRADHIVVLCKELRISADWLLGMEEHDK